MKNEEWELVFHFSLFTFHSSLKKKTYLASPYRGIRGGLLKYYISEESKEVSDEALPYDDEKGVASAKFTTDGCHCCDTRSVEQAEDEEGCSSGGGQDAADAHSCAEEYAQCAHHALLGKEAGDKRCADAPVAKAKR